MTTFTRFDWQTLDTKQKIFDAACVRLRDGTGPATDDDTGDCLYRAPSGNACVVGCMLPDDAITRNNVGAPISGRFAPGSRARRRAALLRWLEQNLGLLTNLQGVHDGDLFDGPIKVELGLHRVASEHDLTYTPPATEPA